MNEKFTTKNLKNDEFNLNTNESDYEKLIIRLKELSKNIALLEKTISI